MINIIIALFFLFFNCIVFANDNLVINNIRCSTTEKMRSVCKIQTLGSIKHGDAIFVDSIVDADKTYVGKELIGQTGYLFDKVFFASFIPRVYGLSKYVGAKNIVISVESYSFLQAKSGIISKGDISIVPSSSAFRIVFFSLAWRMALVSLILLLAVFATQKKNRFNFGLQFSPLAMSVFVICGAAYCISMVKLPRAAIPWLISAENYYRLHIFVLATAVFAFTEMIRTSKLVNTFQSNENKCRFDKVLLFVSVVAWIISLKTLFATSDFMQKHAPGHLIQGVVTLMVFIIRASSINLRWIKSVFNPSDLIFAATLIVAIPLMLVDALQYSFFHTASSVYTRPYIYCLVFVMLVIRNRELSKTLLLASAAADEIRKRVEVAHDGLEKLGALCRVVAEKCIFSRVSIVQIDDNNDGILLASEGSDGLKRDLNAVPLGTALKKVTNSGKQLYYPDVFCKADLDSTLKLEKPCYIVPLIQNGRVVAVIALQADRHINILVQRTIEKMIGSLLLETLAAINESSAQKNEKTMKILLAATSGIVVESLDKQGRLMGAGIKGRRIIISADGVKTTNLDECARNSKMLLSVLADYRKDLYALWLAVKDTFELITTDVRGDDLWLLSPKEFKNPVLKRLGHDKSCLLGAYFIDSAARDLASKDQYRVLGRTGAHVAVCAGEIKITPIGTNDTHLYDVNSPIMSRIHRIRGAAYPGCVLLDNSDLDLVAAAKDASIFTSKPFALNPLVVKDLIKVPEVTAIVDVKRSMDIDELFKSLSRRFSDSDYRAA